MSNICYTYSRGHQLFTENGKDWFYSDTSEPYIEDRPCVKCGVKVNNDEPDPCLGYLPGVKYACCGHGIEGQGYIFFENNVRIGFELNDIKQTNNQTS